MRETPVKQMVRSMANITCSKCNLELDESHFSKNGVHTYSICKQCRRIITARRRYGLTQEQCVWLFNQNKCQCCNYPFMDQRQQHIHHIDTGVMGIVCHTCNRILGQETNEDLYRIDCCLAWMQQDRKNPFDRVNPQGRLIEVPSSTTRSTHLESKICRLCKQDLPLINFRKDRRWYRGECFQCAAYLTAARTFKISYEQVVLLYSQINCDCCGCTFTSKNFKAIHHIDERILGIICDSCNRRLGQETGKIANQLNACRNWILSDDDIVRTVWRHAEVSRND